MRHGPAPPSMKTRARGRTSGCGRGPAHPIGRRGGDRGGCPRALQRRPQQKTQRRHPPATEAKGGVLVCAAQIAENYGTQTRDSAPYHPPQHRPPHPQNLTPLHTPPPSDGAPRTQTRGGSGAAALLLALGLLDRDLGLRVDPPVGLHPGGVVLVAHELGERVDLDDLFPHRLGRVNLGLLLGGGRAAALLAALGQDLVRLEAHGGGLDDHGHAVRGVLGHKGVLSEEVTHGVGGGDELGDGGALLVRGPGELAAAGEAGELHQAAEAGDGEVAEDAKEGFLHVVADLSHRRVKHGVDARHVPVVLVVPHDGVPEVEVGEDVGVAARDELGRLEAAPHGHAAVGAEGKVGGHARHVGLVVRKEVAPAERDLRAEAAGDGAAEVGEGVLDDVGELLVEALEVVAVLDRLNQAEEVGV
mmetsp:Transcript_19711/g.45330  ORF Transcript_19711/g.45330 Transcript_19711/m.45330 type:complete len:416 (-) Transcript_19711:106-1353(-)